MKTRLLQGMLLAASLTLVLTAACQQEAKVAPEPAAAAEPLKGPKIEFESLVFDFGKVGPGQKLIGAFRFSNAGDAPLKITKVEKCCGAVTQLDKDELAPGESGSLQVQYASSRTPMKINKKLYVNSNDKANPRAMLTIEAETVLRVDYEPKGLRLVLKEENAGCPKITLTSTDNEPFAVTSFKATNAALTAEIDPAVEATTCVLEPTADMEKLQKISRGLISIGLAFARADRPPETFSISFTVLSRFTVSPSVLVCVYEEPQGPITRPLWLINNYGEDFEVESTASKEGHIKVLSQRKLANRQRFTLEITPPQGQDVKRFTDTFTITLKGGETVDVACRGIYKAAAAGSPGQ